MGRRLIAVATAATCAAFVAPAPADQPLENNVLNFGQCVSFFAFTGGGEAAGAVASSSGPEVLVARPGIEVAPPGQEPPLMACTTLPGYFPPPPAGTP